MNVLKREIAIVIICKPIVRQENVFSCALFDHIKYVLGIYITYLLNLLLWQQIVSIVQTLSETFHLEGE